MQNHYSLYKVEHRYAVSYRTQDRISIRSEYDIPLSINSAAKVRELRGHVHFKWGGRVRAMLYLEVGFHHPCSIGGKKRKISELGGTWTDPIPSGRQFTNET